MRKVRSAFTLIELMTVIAITAVLLTLIIVPVIQSFTMTRQAQAFATSQERARALGEQIAREISNAAGIKDNAGEKGEIVLPLPALGGGAAYETVPYAKIDIVKPAEGDPTRGPGGGLINPGTGKEDPTLRAPKGQIDLPVAPGATVVRYFIGLKDPFKPYNNPNDGLLTSIGAGTENTFVLYRAEVEPMVYSTTLHKFVVNKAFFYDLSRLPSLSVAQLPLAAGESTKSRMASLLLRSLNEGNAAMNYPAFLDPNDPNAVAPDPTDPNDPNDPPVYLAPDPDGSADPSKAQMVRNWLQRATIVTQFDHSDMIQAVFDRANHQVIYDGVNPRVIPLIQFKPTRISSEPAEGQVAVRLGEETDSANELAPDVYQTQYDGWSNPVVRTYPDTWDQTKPANDLYLVGRQRMDVNGIQGLGIYAYSPSVDGAEATGGSEVFDVASYSGAIGASTPFAFSSAISAALADNAFHGKPNWTSQPNLVNNFIPYYADPARGKILASFGIDEVGNTAVVIDPSVPNLPTTQEVRSEGPVTDDGTGALWSPQDPTAFAASPSATYDINRCFNRAWNDPLGSTLRPDIERFIDLRVALQGDPAKIYAFDGSLSQPDQWASPLDPRYGYPRAHIVPGSEQVFGPDQRPGLNYGNQVQYVRVTRNPGPNQYRINYVDQPEPDYSLLGLPNPQPTYDPTDFTTAVIQPRYKAGYIQLNSDPNVPLPLGAFQVFYRFQFTRPQDVFAVDYDSRQMMSVLLTMRNFPQQGLGTSQNVTIPVTAKVRNFLR